MRILLCDDEKLVLQDSLLVLRECLLDSEFVLANSYSDAINHKDEHFDIAFLDIEMPDKNGLQLAEELRIVNPRLNVIFLTAYPQYALDAYKLQASDYLLKPLLKKDVEKALANLRYEVNNGDRQEIKVIMFDHFTLLKNGKTVQFKREKAKELFAYLVYKKGVSAGVVELCDVLWPESDTDKTKYCWKILSELKLSLKKEGLEDILIYTKTNYSVDVTKINCDYYEYLDGKIKWNDKFCEQFSNWAEVAKSNIYFNDKKYD